MKEYKGLEVVLRYTDNAKPSTPPSRCADKYNSLGEQSRLYRPTGASWANCKSSPKRDGLPQFTVNGIFEELKPTTHTFMAIDTAVHDLYTPRACYMISATKGFIASQDLGKSISREKPKITQIYLKIVKPVSVPCRFILNYCVRV